MNFLIKALLNTKDIENTEKNYPKVILIESPTGTGKTMMLLSSLLEFLDQSKNNDNKNKESDNSNNEEDEEDWLKNFGKNEESEYEGKKGEEDRIKKVNEKMDLILSNIKKKINKKNNEELKLDKEDKKMLIKNKEKASNPFLTFLNKANNASNNIPNQFD
jgi:Rad3-related DNA helicase